MADRMDMKCIRLADLERSRNFDLLETSKAPIQHGKQKRVMLGSERNGNTLEGILGHKRYHVLNLVAAGFHSLP